MIYFFMIVGGAVIIALVVLVFWVIVARVIRDWDREKAANESSSKATMSDSIAYIKAVLAFHHKYLSKEMKAHLEMRAFDLEEAAEKKAKKTSK